MFSTRYEEMHKHFCKDIYPMTQRRTLTLEKDMVNALQYRFLVKKVAEKVIVAKIDVKIYQKL